MGYIIFLYKLNPHGVTMSEEMKKVDCCDEAETGCDCSEKEEKEEAKGCCE